MNSHPHSVIEALESRNLFAALAPDTGFRGGSVLTRFDGVELGVGASAAVLLKNGKLLVGGEGFDKADHQRVLFALYNRDGNLSNTFDGDGKLTLSVDQTNKIGSIVKMTLLTDGNVLVQGISSVIKISAAGKVDSSFGTNGVIDATSIDDTAAAANGGFRLISMSDDGFTRYVTTYTAAGKPTGKVYSANVDGQATFTADGGIAVVDFLNGGSTEFGVHRFDGNFKPKAGFGKNGSVDVKPAFKQFIKANGPFDTIFSDDEGYPTTSMSLAKVGPDGTLLLSTFIWATSPKFTPVARGGEDGETLFTLAWITVSPDGKTIKVNAGDQTYGPGAFEGDFFPVGSTSNGTFYNTAGERQDIAVVNGTSDIAGVVRDANGGAYLFGSHDPLIGGRAGFTVARYAAPSGTIGGYAFADNNSNQIRDSGEKFSVGLGVFLDTDNDGKLDPGEVSTVTDSSGRYVFPNVSPGTYHVRPLVDTTKVRATTFPTTYFGNTVIDGGDTKEVLVGTTTNVWFGSQVRFDTDKSGDWSDGDKPAPGVRVWADLDKDGKYDSNEPTAVTDSNGGFSITSLKAGTYRIAFSYSKPFKLLGEPKPYQDITLTSGATYSSGWTIALT